MKVKELIRLLMDIDPEATVCVEANDVPLANVVKLYNTKSGPMAYIADETDYIDEVIELSDEPAKETNGTFSLDLFIEDEVPFRLREIMGVSEEDIDKIKDILLDKWCVGRGGSFDLFDYDAMDNDIRDILDESGIVYNED